MEYHLYDDPILCLRMSLNSHWVELEISMRHPFEPPYAFARYNELGWRVIVRGNMHALSSVTGGIPGTAYTNDIEELCYFALNKYFSGDALECYFGRLRDDPTWQIVKNEAERLWAVPFVMNS